MPTSKHKRRRLALVAGGVKPSEALWALDPAEIVEDILTDYDHPDPWTRWKFKHVEGWGLRLRHRLKLEVRNLDFSWGTHIP